MAAQYEFRRNSGINAGVARIHLLETPSSAGALSGGMPGSFLWRAGAGLCKKPCSAGEDSKSSQILIIVFLSIEDRLRLDIWSDK